ncbi:MAG: hypothetical protein NVSMB32_04000 [Actinomycetota bacterium]
MISDGTIMPGGGISRRPLHFIILADCSGSMWGEGGEKIQALNFAIADMLPHLAAWEESQELAHVLVRVLSFADVPVWHVPEPTPLAKLRWKALARVRQGRTNMGPAFEAVAEVLGPGRLEKRALRPALLLITDGLPTDPPGRFEAGLEALMATAAGRSALRLAVAIGRDASSDALNRFIGDPAVPVLVADNTDQIAERLVAASLALSRMSEVGADRGAIANQLLVPQAGVSGGKTPGAGGSPGGTRSVFDEDTIV